MIFIVHSWLTNVDRFLSGKSCANFTSTRILSFLNLLSKARIQRWFCQNQLATLNYHPEALQIFQIMIGQGRRHVAGHWRVRATQMFQRFVVPIKLPDMHTLHVANSLSLALILLSYWCVTTIDRPTSNMIKNARYCLAEKWSYVTDRLFPSPSFCYPNFYYSHI